MKYANFVHNAGAVLVIICAVMKIFHFGQYGVNGYLIFAILISYAGQSWKLKLLEKEINDMKASKQ